jgi:ATP-dependent RNA helicase DHX29
MEDISPEEDDEENTSMNVTPALKMEKRFSTSTIYTVNLLDERLIPYDLIIRLLEKVCFEDAAYTPFSAAILVFMPGISEIRRLNDILAEHALFGDPGAFVIYPLHSTISSENQSAAFDIPPPGIRKIVIGVF